MTFDWHSRHAEELSFGERLADKVAAGMGSWPFVIGQTLFILCWTTSATLLDYLWHWTFDPFPWILLNLLFSTQASYSAPIIMMSQNRQAARDRLQSQADHEAITLLLKINRRQEGMLRALHDHMGIEYAADPDIEG